MNRNEFAELINKQLLPHLPDLKKYIGTLDDSTKDAWANSFSGVQRGDLASAIDEIVSGRVTLERYEYGHLSIRLRQLAGRFSIERKRKSESQEQIALARSTRAAFTEGPMSCLQAYEQMLDALENSPKDTPQYVIEQRRQEILSQLQL